MRPDSTWRRWSVRWRILGLVGLALLGGTGPAVRARPLEPVQLPPAPIPASTRYQLIDTFQSQPHPPLGVIEDPVGITVGSDRTVFVVDRALHRAQRFTPEGVPLSEYGAPGAEPGMLYKPSGIAVDIARDRVFISDSGNNRVSVYKLDGTFVTVSGEIIGPESILVSPAGDPLLHIPSSGTVAVLDSNLGISRTFTAVMIGKRPEGVASGMKLGPDGHLYLANGLGIREYDLEGMLLGTHNSNPAGGVLTRDVAFDQAGNLYTLEETRVSYKLPGGLVGGASVAKSVRAIAGGPKGTLYLLMPRTLDQNAGVVVRRFEGTRQVDVRRWGVPLTVLGWLNQPTRITFGDDGFLYVVDELRRVQRFDEDLDLAMGQMVLPGLQEVDANASSDLLVGRTRYGSSDEDPDDSDAAPAGQRRVRVERYTLGGPLRSNERPILGNRVWDDDRVEPALDTNATRIVAMEANSRVGRVYVLDGGHQRVLMFAIDGGAPLGEFALPTLSAGLPDWTDLAIAPDNRVYVLHTAARHAYRFTAEGLPDGALDVPELSWRLDVGPDGTFFIPTARRWIWALRADNQPLAAWQLPSPKFDDPRPPADVAVSQATGRVYVLDQASTAIYDYAPEPGAPTALREPPSPVPAAGSLTCALMVSGAAPVQNVPVDSAVPLSLTVAGRCNPHRRTGETPGVLVRTALITVAMPAYVDLEPGSVQPPAQVSGGVLTWYLTDVPAAGIALRFTVRPRRLQRFTVFESAGVRLLDGWFNEQKPSPVNADYYAVVPPTTTPIPSPSPTPEPPDFRLFVPLAQLN